MELADIGKLVAQYEAALVTEYEAKSAWLGARESAEAIRVLELSHAYRDGLIDGKNAEVRKVQVATFEDGNNLICEARDTEDALEIAASMAEIERKRVDALLSMTRAWLYSQSGKRG